MEYACSQVLPQLYCIADPDAQSQVLRILGEACMCNSDVAEPAAAVESVYQKLLDFMPLPPEDAAAAINGAENGNGVGEPEFEFTKVECLLLAFHTIGKQVPEFLTEDQEKLKDFRVN